MSFRPRIVAPSRTCFAALILAAWACGDPEAGPEPEADPVRQPAAEAEQDEAPEPPEPDVEELDVGDDEDAALAKLGAVPAWSAVIDRANLLARRGDRGAVWGRLGPAAGPYRWLIDETTGRGSLAVRVEAGGFDVGEGDRLVVWGAWKTDGERRWYWDADRVARLPAAEPETSPYDAIAPGHAIEAVAELPEGAIVVEKVERSGGGIFFQLIRGPVRTGDGWVVAGRSHWPPAAIVVLPGEKEAYGGQEMLAPDERWQLEPETSYVLEVRRFRPPRGDGLPVLRAISPPKRVDVEPSGQPESKPE